MSGSQSSLRRLVTTAMLVAVVFAGVSAGFAATNDQYAVSIDGSVDIPTTTYDAEGETVEVSAIGRGTQSDELTFSVDAPAGEYYTVRIVNSEETVVETKAGRGSDSFAVRLQYYDVGTYVIAVTNESGDQTQVYAAQPFVVSGYTVTQDVPTTVERDETFSVEVTIDERDSPPAPTAITVTVGDGDDRVVRDATKVGDSTYVAEFDASTFEAGEYTVVSGVRGEMGFDGTAREYFGISSAESITVTTAQTATTTATATTTSGGSGGEDGSTPTATATATSTATPTATPTATATPSANATPTATPTGATATETATRSVRESGTATPGASDESTETTGGLVQPLGLGLLAALVALLVVRTR